MSRPIRYLALVLGLSLAFLCIGLAVFLLLLEFFGHQQHPYMAILTLGILPLGSVVGVAAAAVGLVGLLRTPGTPLTLPVVDLNLVGQRRRVLGVAIAVMGVMCLSGFGSYQAYEYTDSVQFCGMTCHVMKPEHVAHALSPHAEVSCVECHVGSGASWYIQSKVNGLHQLYEMVTHTWPRPIGVPVRTLRPAQDTCQKCHWKDMFYGEQRHQFSFFKADAKNSRTDVTMLFKIGGDDPDVGPPRGIHWHMNISNQVTYATLDPKRATIPWVQVRSRSDGKVRTYRDTTSKFTDADLSKAEKVVMDCTECHNRPAHVLYTPYEAVDKALALGRISPSLPYVKDVAVKALEGSYATQEEGVAGVAQAIRAAYSGPHADAGRTHPAEVEQAIPVLQEIYRRNYFPEMKTSWKVFPDHLDHVHGPACFRCHDGNHRSDDGKVLTMECDTCHVIISQTVDGKTQTTTDFQKGLEFAHPSEGEGWKDDSCTDCHAPN